MSLARLAALVVFLGLALEARAEPTSAPPAGAVEDPLATLARDDLASVAWGAWCAAEQGLADAGPLLVQRLRELPERRAEPGWWETGEVLLDACIRLGVLPPSDVLLATDGHAAAVAVLCARLAAPDDVLLELFARHELRSGDVIWLAIGNQLLSRRAQGFAAALLRRYQVHRTLRIFDRLGPYPPFRAPSDSVPG